MPRARLIDRRSGPARAWAFIRGVAMSVVLFLTLLLINLLQLSSLVLRPLSRRAFRRVNRWAADTWWGWCVTGAERLNGTRLVLSGDCVPDAENAIVVVNHQDMPDITVIMAYARSKHRLGDLKFFVKKALKYVPGVGWGMQFLDCLFVHRSWTADAATVRRTFETLVRDHVPMWLVSFVEGTRFTLAKRTASHAHAERRGLPQLEHVLLPRTRGFVAAVGALRGHVTAVYDLTIGYVDGVPTLWQYVKGAVTRVHLHVRRFPMDELPHVEQALTDWLVARQAEKDRLLAHFYDHGVFPEAAEEATG